MHLRVSMSIKPEQSEHYQTIELQPTVSADPMTEDDKRYAKTFGIERRTTHDILVERSTTSGLAQLAVRTQGGLIRHFTIGDKHILTSAVPLPDGLADIEESVKMDATITCMPFGKTDPGPQHGLSRFLAYKIESTRTGNLEISAADPLLHVGHRKIFTLEDDGLSINDDVINTSDTDTEFSLAEHFYFAIQESELSQIQFLDSHGLDVWVNVTKEDGTTYTGNVLALVADLQRGESLFVSDFSGRQVVFLPGIGRIQLESSATHDDNQLPTGLMLWHRDKSDTVCLEPTVGFTKGIDGQSLNRGITLKPGVSAQLHTRIRLLEAST